MEIKTVHEAFSICKWPSYTSVKEWKKKKTNQLNRKWSLMDALFSERWVWGDTWAQRVHLQCNSLSDFSCVWCICPWPRQAESSLGEGTEKSQTADVSFGHWGSLYFFLFTLRLTFYLCVPVDGIEKEVINQSSSDEWSLHRCPLQVMEHHLPDEMRILSRFHFKLHS